MTTLQVTVLLSQAGAAGPALTPDSSWGDVFSFLGLGILIVLSTLAGLSVLCAITGTLFKRLEAAAQAKQAAAKASAATPAIVASGAATEAIVAVPGPAIDTTSLPLAAIAAAVAILLEKHSYRITHIMPYGTGGPNPWAEEGRREIFASRSYARH